ncbi:MAG TPA: hypothetical protein V6C81_22900 [Planktothrix sp.]
MTGKTTAFVTALLLAATSVLTPITVSPACAADEVVQHAEKSVDITNKAFSSAKWLDDPFVGMWVLFGAATGTGVVADILHFRPVLPGPNVGTVSFVLANRLGAAAKIYLRLELLDLENGAIDYQTYVPSEMTLTPVDQSRTRYSVTPTIEQDTFLRRAAVVFQNAQFVRLTQFTVSGRPNSIINFETTENAEKDLLINGILPP